MPPESPTSPVRVAIVGGGIAALETVLALHDLAGTRVAVTLIAPEPAFRLRPLAVREPFGHGLADTVALDAFMAEHGGRFRRDAVQRIDGEHRLVRCTTAPPEPYDVLVLALGAVARPAFPSALTFGHDEPLAMTGILRDLEEGWTRSVAFVAPAGCTWPLPLYEIALLTAEDVFSMGLRAELHLVTPEDAPLEVFGETASASVAELLATAGITFHGSVEAEVRPDGHVTGDGLDLAADRVVALPLLEGPRLDGVPCDAGGFIPVDAFGRVLGLDDVYAVGDAADHAIKQGGLATQEADAAATDIARRAGAPVEPDVPRPVLRGRLLTGDRDRFLRLSPVGRRSESSAEALWWPPAKVSARYLAPYLAARADGVVPRGAAPPAAGVDIAVPLEGAVRSAAGHAGEGRS